MSKGIDTNIPGKRCPSLLFPVFVLLYVCVCIAVRRAAISGQHLMATVVVGFFVAFGLLVASID